MVTRHRFARVRVIDYTVEDSIYLRADCAGRGLGRRLLEAVIAAEPRGRVQEYAGGDRRR